MLAFIDQISSNYEVELVECPLTTERKAEVIAGCMQRNLNLQKVQIQMNGEL